MSKIKVIFTDCDGTLTDGNIYYSDTGKISRAFSSLDGEGFAIARKAGIEVIIITGQPRERGDSIVERAADLDVPLIFTRNKLQAVKSCLEGSGLSPENAVYAGNDLNDIEAGEYCKWFFAPQDASSVTKKKAETVLAERGGEGFFREVVMLAIGFNEAGEEYVG